MYGVKVVSVTSALALLMAQLGATPALADTIEAALVRAYQNNPQLNAQRAQVRSTDENVPQALSGYRPKVALTASAGYQYTDTLATSGGSPTQIVRTETHGTNPPRSVGLTVTQTLFNGQQTANRTRVAESQVSGAREGLRVLEQSVLLQRRHHLHGLSARLRDRRSAEEQRSRARADAETDARPLQCRRSDPHRRGAIGSAACRRQDAGTDRRIKPHDDALEFPPHHRQRAGKSGAGLAGRPVPAAVRLPGAVELSLIENPNVTASMYGIDVNYLTVKINEGALLPTVSLQASVQQSYEQQLTVQRSFGASAVAAGLGADLSGRRRIFADPSVQGKSGAAAPQPRNDARSDPRQYVVTAWGQLEAGKAQVKSAQAQVTASEVALNGVREEAKAGQRTTLDVLNAQQALVNARVALVTAQHDRVVASYSVLNAIGRLSPQVLNLATTTYDPSVHYQQVRDSWVGVRTPDGR